MTLPRRVAIIGMGLMGGSLARDLAALGVEVLGHDRDPDTLCAARDAGVIQTILSPSLQGVEAADLLVLAIPVTAATATLERVASRLGADTAVTDLGSTKLSIVRAATELGLAERFVGSHPLAGDHRAGWAASRRGLFTDARIYLCPTPLSHPAVLERVRGMWHHLGARPEVVDAATHDGRLAWTSHLPQIASTALAHALMRAGIDRQDLGPGGRDATRLAGSSPEMWTAICQDNADPLDPAVSALIDDLEAFQIALRSRDTERLHHFFAAAHAWSQAGAQSQ